MAKEKKRLEKVSEPKRRRPEVNILVVDDEIVQIQTLSRGLRSRGYGVDHAMNGEEALEKLHNMSDKVDMVITDYSMPGMNGLNLLKHIRESNRHMPVIMMTAYGDKDIVIDALRHRCDSFIEKPFSLEQLITETERALSNRPDETDHQTLSDVIPKHIHQINNPLMSILGSAELAMLKIDDSETVKQSFRRIIDAAQKITLINKEIMGSGRKIDNRSAPVNLAEIIQDCLDMFKDLLELKKVSVICDMEQQHPVVRGDKFGLEQLFKNLILNAIEAMEQSRHKLLRIKTMIMAEENTVEIHVSDTGCGIPGEIKDTLFTPYVTSKEQGTGLGLCVVKSIVDKHSGTIDVQSIQEQGTLFTVRLPISPENQKQ